MKNMLNECGLTLIFRGYKEPYRIISETKSGKTLTIQRDDIVNVDNQSQKNFNFFINKNLIKNENGKILKIRILKNKTWKIVGNEFDEYSIIFDKKFKQLIN